MRILTRLAVLMSAAAIVLFSAGCDPDTPGGGGVTLPPVITLNSGTDVISFNQERDLSNPTFNVNISGEDGDAPLRDLAILENGLTIPANQLNFTTGQTANNPILTAGADAGGFTYGVEITPSNTTVGPVTFSFRLTDTDGEIATTEVTITYTANPPNIDLLIADGFVSGDATVTNFGTSFDVRVQLDDTEDSLSTFTVLENGTVMDAALLTYTGFSSMNPLQLIPAEAVGVTYTININPDVTMMETRTYTFRVADINGITAERTVSITFDPPMGTALTFDTTGVFFNASGMNFGGIDLDNGTAVRFNSPDAEIEDEGLDNTIAVGMENWRTQISASNNAELRIADLSLLGDGTTFDDVVFSEAIAQAFDDGNAVLGGSDASNFMDIPGDDSNTEIVTTALQAGDVFAVRRDGRSYLIRIDEVNFVAGSNLDNYKISIKW
ncbi:hypothetical protein [Neolewinella persica]|uniref:hypothetical protein n=1 Tax=Neolewinella persica TaxID=70998 RepID=UPI00039ACD52|nr:hypothetical protein [Neolewinella persica]